LLEKTLRDRLYIKRRLKESRKIGQDFLEFCRKNFLSKSLKEQKNKQLIALLNKYSDFYRKFSVVNIPPWLFLADELSKYIEKEFKFKDSSTFTLLLTPNTPSYTKEEELAVLSLTTEIKEKDIVGFEKTKGFKKLVNKYFWIPFDYLGPQTWDEKHYIEKIRNLFLLDVASLKKKKGKILKLQKKLAKEQKEKIKELRIPRSLVYLFGAMKDIAVLQDEKKAITTEAHYYLQNLFKEIGQRLRMRYSDFYYLLNEEIEDALLNNKNLTNLAKNRYKLSISIVKNGKVKVFQGKEALNFAKEKNVLLPSQEPKGIAKELRGIPASMGRAKGIIRVLLSAAEVGKINAGEILVATMTTPDYVPAMRKASAIITDEGGITCHAAIVSRELKKPCIIGTKIATKVLKDGDLVEVDANKGVVKILKK